MALTKISTGGVKDDTADESKLKVSNAGTNGQFLSKQSGNTGGLTWADGASEGTEVKSTGESGTNKFLRTDGDGTSSWQTIPSDSSKANLSGAAFTGEVDIADGQYLDFGNGGLKLRSNANNAYIIEESSGKLQIQASALEIANAAASKTYLYTSDGGSIDLYHNNNKKLETTSSGINVTGQINVNGSALSAAPEVTGTASGSIAANAAVIVKSNGEFKTITGVSESLEADEDGPNANQVSGYSDQHHDLSTAYDATNGKIMAVWYEDRAGDEYTYAAVGTVSGSDVTWGSKVDLFSSNDYTLRTRTRVCCVGSNKFVLVYAMPNPTHRAKAVVLTVSGSSISVGTESHFPAHNYAVTDLDVCATTSGGRFWVVYVSSQYSGCRFNTGTVSGSSISWGGEMVPRDHNVQWPRAKYISELNTMILTWRNTNNYDNEAVAYTNASSTHPSSIGSYMTVDNESTEAGKFPNVDWDSVNNRLVFTYARAANINSASNRLHAKIATISGTSISVGSNRIIVGSGERFNKIYELTVDDAGRFVGVGRGYDDEKPRYWAFKLNSALDGIEEVTAPTLIHSNAISHSGASDRTEIDVEHIGNSKFVITYSQGGGNPKSIKSRTKVYPSTDLTTGNLVGFSNAAYTNGQTATVNVTGNTTTQSGLTAGQKYYITKTGALSTTADDPSVEAGIALSSTKLLIRQ